MSDPVSNLEIEDVLSSIRRLVSEDARPAVEEQQDATPEKLVLTPAFRVEDTDPVEDANAETPSDIDAGIPEHESVTSDETASDSDELAAISDVMTADQGVSAAYAAEFDDSDVDNVVSLDPKIEDDIAATDDAFEDGVGDDTPSEDVWQTTDAVDVDNSRTNDDEAGMNAPDLDEPTTDISGGPAADRVSMLQDVMPSEEDDWQTAGSAEPVDPESEFIEDLSDLDAWEDVDSFDASANTVPFINRATPSDNDSMNNAASTSAGEDDPEVFLSDEAVLDEEALRDLVSELVREELQGALGERITRNVRKLVRREIHRALTSMELD